MDKRSLVGSSLWGSKESDKTITGKKKKKKADSKTPPQEFLIIWVSVDQKMYILYKFSSKLMLPAQGPHLEQYWAA